MDYNKHYKYHDKVQDMEDERTMIMATTKTIRTIRITKTRAIWGHNKDHNMGHDHYKDHEKYNKDLDKDQKNHDKDDDTNEGKDHDRIIT